jgi:type IV pilus assembly protein PilE
MPISKRKPGGFTLIELMITVAIVAILTAIALPSYQGYVRKANRSAAQSFMLSAAAREEQVLLDQRSYVAVAASVNSANFANAPTAATPGLNYAVPGDLAARYDFRIDLTNGGSCVTPAQYCVIATAKGSQTADGNLSLTSTGIKSPIAKWQ